MSSLTQPVPLKTASIPSVDAVNYSKDVASACIQMFHQPHNAKLMDVKIEGLGNVRDRFRNLLSDRINALQLTSEMIMEVVSNSSKFTIDFGLLNNTRKVNYSAVARTQVPNVVGLKAPYIEYVARLLEAMDLTIEILTVELYALGRLVAELSSNPAILENASPHVSVNEMNMVTANVAELRDTFAKMISNDNSRQYINYGEVYHSHEDFKKCNRMILDLHNKLKKINLKQIQKEIKAVSSLIDKLIIRTMKFDFDAAEGIVGQNIKLYSTIIEEASNDIAFAGAVISLSETAINVFRSHEEFLKNFVEDEKLMHKDK